MKWNTEWRKLVWLAGVFALCYFVPLEWSRFQLGLQEGLALTKWYAREHVILCLIPAFFIAGAIATFVRQDSVMRYLGPKAPKLLAYGVASVSGTILAVCSCTVLPLFAGIWRMGAGLGPAIAFLYSGPAISSLAIILTARVLGFELGLARTVGAVVLAAVVGCLMATVFRKEEAAKVKLAAAQPDPGPAPRPLWKTAAWIAMMVMVLIFANWNDADKDGGFFGLVAAHKWGLTAGFAAGLAVAMVGWFATPWWKMAITVAIILVTTFVAPGYPVLSFGVGAVALGWMTSTSKGEMGEWFQATWDFTKLISSLLLGGVFISGMLLGQSGHEGLIPSAWVSSAVGGNSLLAVFLSSIVGAFMYFATLTEIPILQGLLGGGMGKGPALALLLAGPALSLPSMLALWKIMGGEKTFFYCMLVVVVATVTGWIYGHL